jgi:hypothetical protein
MMKALLVAALFSAPCAHAGTSIGGGGTSCGGKFLDNMFRTGKYKPKEDPAYAQIVQPAVDRIRKCLPFFADDLEMALSKPWYQVDCKLKVETGNTSYYSAEQMAYQDRVGIFLDQNLLRPKDEDEKQGIENRGAMILHEMIQGVRIQKLLLNLPNEPDVEDSVAGVLNDKLLGNEYHSCSAMQDGVRKYLLTAYATQPQLDKWGVITLEKKKAEARDSCVHGFAPDLLGGNYAPQRFFDRLNGPTDPFLSTWGCHYLHVPLDDKALKYDAEIRIKAKIQVRHDGEGFYTSPVALKSTFQVCDELGTTFMGDNPAACMSCYAPKKIPMHDTEGPDPLEDNPPHPPGSVKPAR